MALTQSQVSQLYVTVIGRASEGDGNTFWQSATDMATAATDMLASPPAQEYFGTSLDDDQAFIEHIYENTLGKTYAEDPEGVDFWVAALQDSTRGEVVTSLINAVYDYADSTDPATYAAYKQFVNKVEVSNYCADNIETADVADLSAFTGYIANVTDSLSTVADAVDSIDADAGGNVGETFTLTAGDDTFTGTEYNDTYVGTEADLEGDADIIIDASSADNDTLTITGTDFSNTLDFSGATIKNVENIVADINALTAVTVNADGINTASNITLNQTRDASGSTFTINNVFDGSTVVAGTDVNDLDVSTDTADHSVTVDGAAATGTIAATVTGTGNATVNASSADTITVSAGSGDVAVDAAAATSVTADTTGSLSVAAAGSTTANSIDVSGNAIDLTVSAADADITAVGDAAADDDSLTINAADDFVVTLEAGDAFETVTVNASAETVATVDTTAADAYVGDANTTFAGSAAMFDGKSVTGAAEVQLTTLATADLTDVATATNINVADAVASQTLTVANDAQVELSDVVDTLITLKYSDGETADDNTGVLNLTMSKADAVADAVTLDTTADTLATLNLNVAASTGALTLTAGDTDVVATGSSVLELAAASTAGSVDATAMTGAVTATANATNLEISTGSAADTLTVADTSADIAVDSGAGNDTVNVGVAAAGSIAGGAGTDTLNITGAVDLSGATITGFEYYDVNANAVTLDESLVNGQAVVVDGTGSISVDNIGQTLDLSSLVFADTAGTTVDYATNKDSSLGSSAAVAVTGSANADAITGDAGADTLLGGGGADTIIGGAGNDVIDGGAGDDVALTGGAGADTIIGGEGADAINAGTGADTIDLTETTAATDTLTIAADDSTEANMDSITGFDAIATNGDILSIANASVAASLAATDVTGVTSETEVGALTASTDADGILTLTGSDADKANVDTLAEWIDVAEALIADVAGDGSSQYNTMAFEFDGNTYVYQGLTTGASGSETHVTEAVVELVGVTGIDAIAGAAAADTIAYA